MRLECGETWSGNRRTASLIELPGMVTWVHSVPAGSDDAGGDVQYVSVCPSCLVCRVALADVSGHGEAVLALGEKLRELMQRYLRELEQVSLMQRSQSRGPRRTRRRPLRHDGRGRVARPKGLACLDERGSSAAPLVSCRSATNGAGWKRQRASERERPAGVPLGLLADISYDRTVVKPQSGDLVVLYSDGVSEATNQAGEELGRDGLMNIARGLDRSSAEAFGIQLTSALRGFRGGVDALDDETVIVLQRVADPGVQV